MQVFRHNKDIPPLYKRHGTDYFHFFQVKKNILIIELYFQTFLANTSDVLRESTNTSIPSGFICICDKTKTDFNSVTQSLWLMYLDISVLVANQILQLLKCSSLPPLNPKYHYSPMSTQILGHTCCVIPKETNQLQPSNQSQQPLLHLSRDWRNQPHPPYRLWEWPASLPSVGTSQWRPGKHEQRSRGLCLCMCCKS